MNYRRLVFAFAALPLACFAYACSSSSNDNPPDENITGEDAATDSPSETPDTGVDAADAGDASDAADASDADADADAEEPPVEPPDDGLVSCVGFGNPLTADPPADGADFPVIDSGDPAAAVTRIVTEGVNLGDTFVNGPRYIEVGGVGKLVYSEFYPFPAAGDPASGVFVVDPNGDNRTPLRAAPGNSGFLGNAVAKDGTILSVLVTSSSADPDDPNAIYTGNIYQLSPVDGTNAGPPISTAVPGDPNGLSNDPKDLVVGPKGDIYFTDAQFQTNMAVATGLYRIPPGGTATLIATPNNNGWINGIALSPDTTKLYTSIYDNTKVVVWTVNDDGSVMTPSKDLVGTVDGPEALAVDTAGNLWVAESDANGAQSGRVEVFTPDGLTKYGEISFQDQRPTGVAFGGADNQTLFITTELGIYTYRVRCAGIR
ncbi:MAG: SMP-30/gluconolactonase/LRE family protein [Polyangiaceae bacterium]|nr:SMP-30/gluconolactonase/LRE family protein [Polyangiaceae bacterium]